jgi:hypothetical protein
MLFTRRSAAVVAGLFILCGVTLRLMGRVGWCKYGFSIYSPAWSHCTSQNILDPYTLSHVLHGIIFFWALTPFAARIALHWRLVIALVMEIGWEILENTPFIINRYRDATASLDYSGDSVLNSLSDVTAALLGFIFASKFGWKTAVAVIVVFELWALAIARDNLSLNVLMLFWPIDAIKEWQMPS